ncbi:MAG: histidinol phosphate phosphatase [Sphingobacteriales bacterium UTBCD1]|jgi:D-glycero-alpha-D-manno-heptose 1-phosphate guanylyltransferase|nr:MAG: histidinol phosphate phosphatase [Sphingobacteriales bacterium UTBCD1]
MVKEAVILAGGFGTRLRDAVPDLPKCMAPVNEQPFLTYVIRYLLSQGIEKFIFSLGYKHKFIEEFLETEFPTINYQCCIEHEPLGTGGAIRFSIQKTTGKNVLVLNGDTLYKIDTAGFSHSHQANSALCSIALKPMKDFDRYGVVELGDDNIIKDFNEKQFYPSGLINGGIYLINREAFLQKELPDKFSFEKDFLEKEFMNKTIFGFVHDNYFIDIGIPGDYKRVQEELKYHAPDLDKVDKSWTLFIDRDGVINHEKKDDYIRNWQEFHFYDMAKESLAALSKKFGKVIIVSNQRGVGRGLMTEEDLIHIHKNMEKEIAEAGGHIDKIYYCSSTDIKDFCRKPNPGMALKAEIDFPDISFSHSLMVGNNSSDMLFGRNAGMFTVFLKTTKPEQALPHPDIDLSFYSLIDFARACR